MHCGASMEYRVELSPRALRDIESTYLHYAEIDLDYAIAWFNGIEVTIESLEMFPLRCGLAFESDFFDFELRQHIYGKGPAAFRILFSVRGDVVHVHHVRHCRRKPISEIDAVDDAE